MVNIDTIYQRVLALANKEQRGYITPQEFNLFANQAQMEIFEQYFYDLSGRGRIPETGISLGDVSDLLEEKVDIFLETFNPVAPSYSRGKNIFHLPDEYYKIVEVRYGDGNIVLNKVRVERLSYKEFNEVRLSPLTEPTLNRPAYYQKDNRVIMWPTALSDSNFRDRAVQIAYIRKPKKVNWTYVVVGNKPLYNPSAEDLMHFELHPSEETKLVIKILALAGITLKDNSLYQIAGAEDTKSIQQEKQ
jgi:hypothetical protein